jgi:hypothetical protein
MKRRRRILDVIPDHAVRKRLILRWLSKREIWGDEAEALIGEYAG